MHHATNDSCSLPLTSNDVLTDLLRQGAQKMLAEAINAEVADWIAARRSCRDDQGHQQVVRNGYLPKRTITSGTAASKCGSHACTIGNGALGFWKALPQVFETTRPQRCWVHKTANVLDNLPKSMQSKAKSMLHAIYQAPSRAKAEQPFDLFLKSFGAKYPKATECLAKDRDSLLTFYDYPAEHWLHIRSTNVIESVFATVRLRTAKTKGSGNREACLRMVFKLMESEALAGLEWHRPPDRCDRGHRLRGWRETRGRRLMSSTTIDNNPGSDDD